VWSASVSARLRLLLQPGLRSDYTATIFEDDDTAPGSPVAETAEGADGSRVRSAAELDEVVAKIAATGLTPRCVVAASELGVEFADQLAMHMGLPNNGTALSDCRRDKFAMGERVRAAGVRAVKQRLCSTWEEAHAFLLECGVPDADTAAEHALDRALEGPAASGALRMVIKPARSGGSDDVFLCSHMAEFREKFHHIIGKKNKLNALNTAVLLQEYLQGVEFVIDTVSRDGHHKLAGCWNYMKGSVNGAAFVYFGMRLIDGANPVAQEVFEYTKKVLDALEIKNWCGHAEVMYHPQTGPCLVEIGSRPHGGEGIFIDGARAVCGHSQIDLLAAAMTSDAEFAAYPDIWAAKHGAAAIIDLVSFQTGTVKGINEAAMARVQALPSFKHTHCMPEPGTAIVPTIDCFTTVGSITLVSTSEEALNKDIEVVRDAERSLFDLVE